MAALAEWHFGRGPGYCRGCRDTGAPCADPWGRRGGACAYRANAAQWFEEAQAQDIVLSAPLVRAGMNGTPTSLDRSAALATARALGYDERVVALLLPAAERGLAAAVAEDREE